MNVGIDGDKWYCSNGLSLPEHNAKFAFARTLREAVTQYNKEFNMDEDVPERLRRYADETPEQYKLRERSRIPIQQP
jgi:hypothetical protein